MFDCSFVSQVAEHYPTALTHGDHPATVAHPETRRNAASTKQTTKRSAQRATLQATQQATQRTAKEGSRRDGGSSRTTGSRYVLAGLVGLLLASQAIPALAVSSTPARRLTPISAESLATLSATLRSAVYTNDSFQDDQSQDDASQDEALTDEERLKKYRGRLPNYFGKVINSEQRSEIYAIQAKYNEQIASLEAQIEKLSSERDQQVEGVLTPEQLAEVNKMRDDAKSRRQARDAAKKSGDGAGTDAGNDD